jgi:hypothetical protein
MKLQQVSDNCFAVLGHDDLIDPGAEIEISFERLGTLRSRFAEPACKLPPGRCGWRCRDSMARSWRVGAAWADLSLNRWYRS